jgi:hypothetical protein
MRKEKLFLLVKENQPKEKRFRIDQYVSALGHTVVRLPPYMYDLNAIELAWAKVKNHVRDANTEGNVTLKKLKELTEDAFKTVTKQDWVGYCSHVRKLKLQHWEKDGIVSVVIDEIVISLGDETDSSLSESDTSEDRSESDDGNDSDLAQPLPSEPSGHPVTESVCFYFSNTIFYKLKICPFLLLR